MENISIGYQSLLSTDGFQIMKMVYWEGLSGDTISLMKVEQSTAAGINTQLPEQPLTTIIFNLR